MAVPTSTLWPLDPHTAAKHQILRWYLQAWFPILGRHHRRIVYFEGFAGPGQYEGAEPGSPLVALDAALEQRDHIKNEVVFFLVEANEERAEHLRDLVESRKEEWSEAGFSFEISHAEFASELAGALDELDTGGLSLAPTFAFIDPFGFKGLPMSLIHRVLQYPRTEAFINFPVNPVNRFIEHPNEEINAQMIELFGTPEALDHKGFDALRQLYQRQLEQVAKYVRFFTMYRADGQPVYDLFFASNNLLGLTKMKEAMWRADPDGAFRFSDATDPNQAVLFGSSLADPSKLLSRLLARYNKQSSVPVEEIEAWTLEHTPFMGKHMRAALKHGEEQGAFTVHSVKRDGKPRHGKSFPADVVIDFTTVPPPPPPAQPSLFG